MPVIQCLSTRLIPAFILVLLLPAVSFGMGYKVKDLVACSPPQGVVAAEQLMKTECPIWDIFGCDDELVIPMTDLSEYGECRLHVISGFDPVVVTISTPKGRPVPQEYPNFTAKAGRHSQEVCTHWFPVEENGGKFEVTAGNFGPAGQYSYKVIIECLSAKPTDGGTASPVHEGVLIPEFKSNIDFSKIGGSDEPAE